MGGQLANGPSKDPTSIIQAQPDGPTPIHGLAGDPSGSTPPAMQGTRDPPPQPTTHNPPQPTPHRQAGAKCTPLLGANWTLHLVIA
mmetsp:Transcript_53258/g.95098  ORF Transcript_53258/g.95098 Transcript_53258/m.95098 type:complete len:86 (+) Transcript_53258:107-364(+)